MPYAGDDAGNARVLILSASMGGGHLQISRELARRLASRGHQASVIDVLEVMPRPTGAWLHALYPWLVSRTPRLYQRIHEVFLVSDRSTERTGVPVRLALPGLRRVVGDLAPTVAVATHPLAALALGELRARGRLTCPAITLVTTFSVNNMWLHPAADLEICISSDAAAEATRRTGRPTQVCGPVVRPAFQRGRDAVVGRRERERLGVPADARVALLSTGSMGFPGAAAVAAATIADRPGWWSVVLCGRNRKLLDRVQRLPATVALPWVDDMPALMSAADVLVDNACGTSAKEALAIGLPVVTFRPISGHGVDDVAAVSRIGLTDATDDEHRLVDLLDELVGDPDRYADRVARGRGLFVADAADLVEAVADQAPRDGRPGMAGSRPGTREA